jgi:hypothetical protein
MAKTKAERKRKEKKQPGVFAVKGKKGASYGIDYIHTVSNARAELLITAIEKERLA